MGVKFQHEGLALSVWLGCYQWFQRSFVTSVVMTNQNQHLNIYLIFVVRKLSVLSLAKFSGPYAPPEELGNPAKRVS